MTAASVELLPAWLRLCAANRELLADYDRLRGTNLSGRGTPMERMVDHATGRFEPEAQGFFDWCVECFERLGWDETNSQPSGQVHPSQCCYGEWKCPRSL